MHEDNINYNDYNDNELLNYISEHNEDANEIMFKKYEPLIFLTAKKMQQNIKNTGLELGDLIQEGMLGLSNAIETFQESKNTLFYTYAKTCIERRIYSLLTSTKRLKNKALNESISFDFIDDFGNESRLECLLKDDSENPEHILLSDEYKDSLIDFSKKNFTDFERQVFELKIDGFEYKEIATILNKDPKSVDNAIQRIKAKLKDKL